MCLDLAASMCGSTVNKSEAIRVAGVNKKVYTNGLKAFESMLDLQGDVSIKEMGVQFGCTGAVTLAEECLQSYIKEYNNKSCAEMDFGTSLFQAASLCAACRQLKIKVDRVKLKEVCSVKHKTFDRLVTELEKHAEKIQGAKKVVKQKRSKTLLDEIERQIEGMYIFI
ncbi:hypothetical protein KUTeg_019581 [Tegillarca granosa]|uniref:Origin recognition complex subunit 6 n=1 Tax=Tegillarca granosa TaxID=220873 RepID=A0ABQ9EDG1_TEGGR|nr:hypothetical protein KUTeg_019581 [Tegillarca granosa]